MWKEKLIAKLKAKGFTDEEIRATIAEQEAEINGFVKKRLERQKNDTPPADDKEKIKKLVEDSQEFKELLKSKELSDKQKAVLQEQIEAKEREIEETKNKQLDLYKTEKENWLKDKEINEIKMKSLIENSKKSYLTTKLLTELQKHNVSQPQYVVDLLLAQGYIDAEPVIDEGNTFKGFSLKTKEIPYKDKETKVEKKASAKLDTELPDYLKVAIENDPYVSNFVKPFIVEKQISGSGSLYGSANNGMTGNDEADLQAILDRNKSKGVN